MKKELLVSAILGASIAGQLSAQEVSELVAESIAMRQEIIDLTFESAETFDQERYVENTETGEYELKRYQAKVRLKFIAAQDGYTFDGNEPLDYEVIVEYVDVASGEAYPQDRFFYAKRESHGKFTLYDCDSTKRCSEDYSNSIFYAFDTPYGKGLRVRNAEQVLVYGHERNELVFHQVRQ